MYNIISTGIILLSTQSILYAEKSNDTIVIPLSELQAKERQDDSSTLTPSAKIHIQIESNDVSWEEFSNILTWLYRHGISKVFVQYKGKTIDIASHGIEWDLAVTLKEDRISKNIQYPLIKNVKRGNYLLMFWKINSHHKIDDIKHDIEKFKKMMLTLANKHIALCLLIDPEERINHVLDYLYNIPNQTTVKGTTFITIPAQ